MIRNRIRAYKPYYWSNLALAMPVVVSQLGHTLVHTADSMIVGHFVGTIPLAAVSLVHSVFMIVMVFGIGIATGLTPLVAMANGSRKPEECGLLLSNSLLINVVSGILLFCLVYFGSMVAIDHLDQDPEVVEVAKPYLLIMSLSIIDRCLMALVMAIYTFRAARFKPYLKYFSLLKFQLARCMAIVRIGAPVAMQYVFEVGAFAGAAILAGTLGANEQAAHQIAITLAAMTYMMASGIASAATVKTANSYGKQKFLRLKRFATTNYHIVLVFMVAAALIFVLFNQYLPWIFTTDTVVIGIAAQLLLIAGVFQLFDGTQVVGLGILRGLGDVKKPTVITFVAYWVIGLPAGYFMSTQLGMGILGIWYGLTAGLLTSSILLYFRYQKLVQRLALPS